MKRKLKASDEQRTAGGRRAEKKVVIWTKYESLFGPPGTVSVRHRSQPRNSGERIT